MRTASLRAKLLASVLTLFLIVSALTAAFTVFAVNRSLTQQVDESLLSLTDRFGDHGRDRVDDNDSGTRPPPGSGGGDVLRVVYNPSTGIVSYSAAKQVGANDTQVAATAIQRIQTAGLSPNPTTVDLGTTLGNYRMVANVTPNKEVAVTGVPLAAVEHTRNQLALIVALCVGLGLLAVLGGGSYLIRRNLEPLRRVAATASHVSDQDLERGEVTLVERVPAAYTDTRTEVGQVGHALNALLDNVGGALSARHRSETRGRQFVADASHELRTPLASIKGYAELSRREKEPVPASVTHALGRIESEAGRMTGLVEDMLLLARLDAGRPLERKPVDLTMMAVEALSDAHAAAPDHEWTLELPDEPVEVIGDESRLRQVLVNLLGNARSHTPPTTRVVLGLTEDALGVRISVSDNGPGIPADKQGDVFQRFTRGDEARERSAGSTGLGLSIVDAVARAHGGRVLLDSEPGATTFTVFLPAHPPVVKAP